MRLSKKNSSLLRGAAITLILILSITNRDYAHHSQYDIDTWAISSIIRYIKSHEGLRHKPYHCAGGYLSIGYGHILPRNTNIQYLDSLQCDSLLRIDFGKCMLAAQQMGFRKINQKIAVGHFLYAVGLGNFNKSKLKKAIFNADTADIHKKWLKWCYIKNKKNKNLRKQRHAELSIYLINTDL